MSKTTEKAYRVRDYLINRKEGGSIWNLELDSVKELVQALDLFDDPREIQNYLDVEHFWGFNTSIADGEPVDEEFLAALEYADKPNGAELQRELGLAAAQFVAWFMSGNSYPAPGYEHLNNLAQNDLHRLVTALESLGYRQAQPENVKPEG